MNKSIYRKQHAFKKSLPKYGLGGKKMFAGLAGFTKNLPGLGQMADPFLAKTDAVKENPTAYASGDFAGSLTKTVGMGIVNPMSLASNVPDTLNKGLNLGSVVSSEKGNENTAADLGMAANSALATGQQIGQFASLFGGSGNIPLMMKNGGNFNSNKNNKLIKYNLPSHEEGGGAIDANGKIVNPNSELAQAEIEKKETLDTNQDYIFSDTLKPMKSKLTFADLSKKIDSKYKNKTDEISISTKNRELEKLKLLNEKERLIKESNNAPMMKNGGSLKKYTGGGFSNWYNQPLGSGTVDNFANSPVNLNSAKPNAISTGKSPFGIGNNMNILPPTNNNPNLTNPFNINVNTSNTSDIDYNKDTLTVNNNTALKRLQSQGNSNSNPQDKPFGLTNGDKLQLGAGALSGITNLAMGLKKPDKYDNLTSPYFSSGLDDMNQKIKFNTNPILLNRNTAAHQINQGSTSDGTRRSNLQSMFSRTNTQLGELAEKESIANAQIQQQLGSAKIGVGARDLAAREQSRSMNIQSKAIAQNLRSQGLQQMFGSVSDVGKGINQSQSNTIQLNVLNSLASQYGVDPETLKIIFKQQGVKVI